MWDTNANFILSKLGYFPIFQIRWNFHISYSSIFSFLVLSILILFFLVHSPGLFFSFLGDTFQSLAITFYTKFVGCWVFFSFWGNTPQSPHIDYIHLKLGMKIIGQKKKTWCYTMCSLSCVTCHKNCHILQYFKGKNRHKTL